MRPSCESTEANAGNVSPQPNSPRITVKRLITHALSLTFGHGLRTDNHPPRPCSSHRRRREGDRSEPQCSASCSFVREVLGGSDRLRTPSTGSDRTSPRQVNRIPIATASPHSASNPADVCNAQPNRGETTATAMAVTDDGEVEADNTATGQDPHPQSSAQHRYPAFLISDRIRFVSTWNRRYDSPSTAYARGGKVA